MSDFKRMDHILPVGTLKIAALEGCRDLGNAVDKCLVKSRKEAKDSTASGNPPAILQTLIYSTALPEIRHRRRKRTYQ